MNENSKALSAVFGRSGNKRSALERNIESVTQKKGAKKPELLLDQVFLLYSIQHKGCTTILNGRFHCSTGRLALSLPSLKPFNDRKIPLCESVTFRQCFDDSLCSLNEILFRVVQTRRNELSAWLGCEPNHSPYSLVS